MDAFKGAWGLGNWGYIGVMLGIICDLGLLKGFGGCGGLGLKV